MSDQKHGTFHASSASARRRAGTLASLFALTAAGLALEVSLTRLFSFLFVQSYVYLVVSLSVSGIGLGAVIMYYVPTGKRVATLQLLVAVPPALLALLFVVSSTASSVAVALIVTAGIFAALGATQVHVFRSSGIAVSRLYAADLLGAATGSVLAFFVLNAAGAVNAVIAVVALLAVAMSGALAAFATPRRAAVSALAVLSAAVVGLLLPIDGTLMPAATWNKEMTAMLSEEQTEAEITETRWSAFGRVDMVESNNPLFRTMFIDGGAGTKMVRMQNGQVSQDVARTLLLQYMGGVPLLVKERGARGDAAVIGSGGGIDVVTLLVAGFDHIDAVEINPDFVEIVRDEAEYTGGIYRNHERVDVHVTEGRSFLRNTDSQYDVILMGLPIIKSARNFGNHALTENYLFTHEAFSEYRRALADGGMLIAIAHYRNELLRLVSNAVRSFEADGLTPAEAVERIVTVGDPQNPTLVLKDEPFTAAERRDFATILRSIPTSPDLSFVPGLEPAAADLLRVNAGLRELAGGQTALARFVERADEDISAISDNSPFFYQLEPGLPREMTIVASVVAALVLALTILFATHLHGTPDEARSRQEAGLRFTAFGVIGIGYMTVEIAVLQKFIVFWQHETLALAVVLSVVLVASGLGSLASSRISPPRGLARALALVFVLLVAALWFLEPLLASFEFRGPATKVLVTVLVTTPVFFPLGMAFPVLLKSSRTERYPWMMGINSLMSLAGGVAAMIVALSIGYRAVMGIGILAYGLLLVLLIVPSTQGVTRHAKNVDNSL